MKECEKTVTNVQSGGKCLHPFQLARLKSQNMAFSKHIFLFRPAPGVIFRMDKIIKIKITKVENAHKLNEKLLEIQA